MIETGYIEQPVKPDKQDTPEHDNKQQYNQKQSHNIL